MDDPELLALFGFDEDSGDEPGDSKFATASLFEVWSDRATVTYNVYMQLGVDGLRGLRNFNVDSNVSLPSPQYRSEPANLGRVAELGSSS